jgi:hypothetical protein
MTIPGDEIGQGRGQDIAAAPSAPRLAATAKHILELPDIRLVCRHG